MIAIEQGDEKKDGAIHSVMTSEARHKKVLREHTIQRLMKLGMSEEEAKKAVKGES